MTARVVEAGRWSDTRRIARAAWPLYLSMIAISFSALVNTAVLGRYGTVALAGFAVTGAVYFPAMAAVSGAVRGVMPFVAGKAEDRDELLQVVRDATLLAVVGGMLGAIAVACVPLIARASGVPAETVEQLGIFPLLLAGSVLLNAFGSMATSSLVGLGRSEVVLRAGLLGAACIMVLSPVLVLGLGMPALGLIGAGIALFASNLVICLMTMFGLSGHLGARASEMIGLRMRPRKVLELAKVGIPLAGTVLVKFSMLGVLALAAARVGTASAATHNIATALVNLTFTAAVAIGQAAIPLVSSYAGSGDLVRVRRSVSAGLALAMVVLLALGALLLILQSVIVDLFTADPDVIALTSALLPLVVLATVGDGAQATLGFGLTGLKRTVPSLLVFAACYGLLAFLAVPVANMGGLTGLWLALVTVNLLAAVGQGAAFYRYSSSVVGRRRA